MKKLFSLLLCLTFASLSVNAITLTSVASPSTAGTAKFGTGQYSQTYTSKSVTSAAYYYFKAEITDNNYEFDHWEFKDNSGTTNKDGSAGSVLSYFISTSNGNVECKAVFRLKSGGGGSGSGGSATVSEASFPTSSSDKIVTVYRPTSDGKSTVNYTLPNDVVDMGDGGYWRTKNVNAVTESGAGNYYQWGKTTQSHSGASGYTNPTTADLVSTYDAATANCGGDGYCIPSQTEWADLISSSNSTWEWSGTYTLKITSKTTGNSITLPVTGYYDDNNPNNTTNCGVYWSRTYNSGKPYTLQFRTEYDDFSLKAADKGTYISSIGLNDALYVRPIYRMASGTLHTLTLTIIDAANNHTYTQIYKGISTQNITVSLSSTESNYNVAWTSVNGNSSSGSADKTFTLSSDKTATITYSQNSYTITYNKGNYGTGTQIANGSKTKDATYTISSSTYTRDGYTQDGWSTTDGGSKAYAFGASYTTNAALNLYPYWTAKTYTATNNINGNGGNNGTYTATYDATSLTINTAPTREGHTLEGLYKEAGCTNKIANASGSLMANTAYTNSSSKWTNDGNVTLYAKWTVNNYTVTFKSADGTTTLQGPTNYSYGATITSCPIPVQQSGNTVFAGWTLNGNTSVVYTYEQIYNAKTVTGDMVFTAKYVPAISVTIPAFTNNGKVLVTANGTTYNVTSDGDEIYVANGSNVTIQAVPNAYYHFAAWEEDDQADDFIEYRPLNASVTYTPTWEQNVALPLVDTENEAYYTALYSNATYAGKMLTVTMTGRRLTAGSWMTFCAPFEFDIPAGHPMDGAVYRFINGTMTGSNTEGYISLDFRRTHKIEANVPYLVVAKTTTDTDLEFDGVTIEDNPTVTPVEASSHHVQFVSQPWKGTLLNNALELADFYIASGNTLRYASSTSGTTIRAFRAYFHRLIDLGSAPRRLIINLDGVETTKEIGMDGEIEDTTRKYMENGVLYIERNGVRYDAQGQRAE